MEYTCEIVYSPDEGGYQVRIWDPVTDQALHLTDVCLTQTEAWTRAQLWVNGQAKREELKEQEAKVVKWWLEGADPQRWPFRPRSAAPEGHGEGEA